MQSARILTPENASEEAEAFISTIPVYPDIYAGRGIVICGGGVRYFTNAWVCINMLRKWGCNLPIQVWHFGAKEMDKTMQALLQPLGVTCVDANLIRERHPVRILNGYELKPYSIIHSPFREVLLLDADNVPLVNPNFLFSTDGFLKTGAIFWPDYNRLASSRSIWNLCGVQYRDEPEFESGQIVIDKEKCWKSLCLTMWYNEHSDFFYRHVHGDKETFHMAFRKMGQDYSMVPTRIYSLESTMCQHDFDGRRIFQHRNMNKWEFSGNNKIIKGFLYEEECRKYLAELRLIWSGQCYPNQVELDILSKECKEITTEILGKEFVYHRVGHDFRVMTFLDTGEIGKGKAANEELWKLKFDRSEIILEISSRDKVTCCLIEDLEGTWRGRWIYNEQMPIELLPKNQLDFNNASILLVSLPRSSSTFFYHVIQRATGLSEPVWTTDGEILNIDRYELASLKNNVSEKFTDERQAKLFYKTIQFLNQIIRPQGFIYKDVIQPFVISEWVRTRGINTIYIKRNIADVAYSMLRKQWYYPKRLFPEIKDEQMAVIKGLINAEAALSAASPIRLDFDQIIFDEQPVRDALSFIYKDNWKFKELKYIDERFEKIRDQVLNRRNSDQYFRILDLISQVTEENQKSFFIQNHVQVQS